MQILPPPGPQRTRQIVLLAVMLVVLAIFGWRQFGPAPTANPISSSNPVAAAGGADPSGVLPEQVKLGELEPVPVEPSGDRNLFRFGMKPAPPPPPRQELPPPVSTPPPTPVPTGPPAIPLKAVGRYVVPFPVGIVKDPVTGRDVQAVENRPVVTLKDPATGRIIQAYEGMIVDGKYKVLKIGLQSVEMSYLDGSGYRRIPIGGS
ncbi:MAG: hypothetical protein R2752_19710 [Vicinamibacterales bacterium]